jgi:glyoxylase-like metal-dependent hydrolase (beta-lactamase superfamily II)
VSAAPTHHLSTDWGSSFPRRDWFDVRPLADGVWLLAEPGHVNSYLISGSDHAVLMDTGLGVADIRTVAEGLTGKPLVVVNSHHHFDHTGGNDLFENIAIHRSGATLLEQAVPAGVASGYMDYTQRLLGAWEQYKGADDLYFHLITSETLLRPLPEGFNPGQYRVTPSKANRLLDDGEVLDLGGRQLRVVHTPGHSPDSICLLDEANGLLFGGDTINTGPIYAQLEGSDVEDFAASTRRLAGLADSVDRVFVCHFMRFSNDPALLGEIAEGFERIVCRDAGVVYRDNLDCLNFPVREACFDRFSVFLPTVDGPRATA